jgi:23S rRNA (guanosine2251-2'-O)-methyltransferase
MSDRTPKPPFRRGGGKPFEKGRKFARSPGHRGRDSSSDGPVILYGWHTVSAALANPDRQIRKMFLT